MTRFSFKWLAALCPQPIIDCCLRADERARCPNLTGRDPNSCERRRHG